MSLSSVSPKARAIGAVSASSSAWERPRGITRTPQAFADALSEAGFKVRGADCRFWERAARRAPSATRWDAGARQVRFGRARPRAPKPWREICRRFGLRPSLWSKLRARPRFGSMPRLWAWRASRKNFP